MKSILKLIRIIRNKGENFYEKKVKLSNKYVLCCLSIWSSEIFVCFLIFGKDDKGEDINIFDLLLFKQENIWLNLLLYIFIYIYYIDKLSIYDR